MKKFHTLAFTAFLLLATVANAQIKKDAILLGGNLNFGSGKSVGNNGQISQRTTAIGITPVIGKAIRENLVLGVSAGINFQESKATSGGVQEVKSTGYSAGVFLRKYKFIGKSGFSIFIDGALGGNYGRQTINNGVSPEEQRTDYGVSINTTPGISYTLTRKLQLEAGFRSLLSLGYNHTKSEVKSNPSQNYSSNNFNLSANLSNFGDIYVGFRVLLNKS